MTCRTPGRRPRFDVTAAGVAGCLAALLLAASPVSPPVVCADDLGSARLLIAGTELSVSPESQTVPFNTPTIVDTELTGYDPAAGVLPDDLRVLGDLTGPEIDGILVLETRPGQPFRIPRLSLKGEYVLDDIRLMQGDELLAYASPRSAVVLVTQVLVTRVTSRALTLDEIRSYGIVVDDDDFTAFNFTFGFAVDGEVYDYNLPVIYSASTSNPYEFLVDGAPQPGVGGGGTSAPRFRPPQMAPFTLQLESSGGGGGSQPLSGGCQSAFGCQESADVRLPGVILFPTDVSLLHQYFSVVLMAKNDAPAGDPLVIRDLTAKVTLPPGLRMAETEPPTPLGVPVPVRVPGPDGKVGTGDDLTFLVAQASGEAEVLVEGRKVGTHVVEFDLDGVLEGLPDGSLRHVTGKARGAVVVRDPTLGVTISHPATVRADEEYDLRLTVANTSNAPLNLVTLSLPSAKLSGAQVVGASQMTIPTLPPGESEVVDFRMRSLRTGKVVASSSRSPYFVDPTFELTVGVGENGIPLSPDAIILPRSADELPDELVRQALGLTGLGFSLATAPAAGLDTSLPRMELNQVDEKVYHLGQAGRHVKLGEATFDAVATLAAEWTGVRNEDWEWDRLRRTTDRGGALGDAIAAVLAAEAQATSPRAAFDRFAATTAFQGPSQAALAVGTGARLEVASRITGDRLSGGGLDPGRRRELPFTDLYDLAGGARMALLARPEEGGYQARLTVDGGGTADLHLLVPGSGGGLRRVSWTSVALGAAGLAVVDFTAGDDVLTLFVDDDGDGLVDQQLAGTATTLTPRPFTAVAAVQKETEVTGHVVEVLFSADVDLASLLPLDPQHFQLPGNLSNGGMVPMEADLAAFQWMIAENKFAGLRNTRVVQVVFSNPVSPYVAHSLTVQDLSSTSGETLASVVLPVTTTVTDPGGIVEGTVVGPDGEPVPFARVELYEADVRWIDGECIRHRTAATQSDAGGVFHFDYVRNGTCSDVYLLRGTDPQTGYSGEARGRVRFPGQVHALNVVMLGRGTVRGRVTYDDGTVPAKLRVVAYSPVFAMGVDARIFPDGSYEAREVPVGTVSLAATDRQGGYVFQTIEVPTAGAVVDRDLVILRRSPDEATGDVRGTAYEADGTSPAYNAYLVLYVDGELVGVERSALDGSFDFGTVPAGQAQIEGFDGETGLSGAQLYFEVLPDQVNAVDVLLRDERGAVEGHVYRQTTQGQVPVVGAVVWVGGTPFNTVTDDLGFYRLDGVFAGTRTVYAADLERQEQTAELVTVSDGLTVTRDLRFVEDFGEGGIVGEVLGFTGNPVPGAKVHIAAGSQSWWLEAVSDTTGRFSIPDLKPGTYELHAVSGSGGTAVGGTAVAQIHFQGETPFVSIRFKKGTIRGRTVALDQYGQKVGVQSLVTYRTTQVQEGLVNLSWSPTVIETDADGWFEIPDVLAGRYSLAVSNAFHGDQTVNGELVFHGEVAEHEIVFQRNGSISGVVYDVDGETPVPGAVVYLRHPSFSDYDLVTDAEGRFSFELVPPGGRFPIEVEVQQGALFRHGQVWVSYNRHGLDMEVEITLPKQGTVSGWVEEASGQRVPGAMVTLAEHAYPHRRLVQTADGEGYYSFTNVFAGRVTVEAQAPSLGGLGGKTVAELSTEGEEVWTLIALEGSGEIAGTVLAPVDGQPVPSAQVTLYRWTGGVLDAVTADAEGAFRFRQLPIGLYRVWVFDPTTGRNGATDAVAVDFDGQLTEIAVELEVRGEVEGHLIDPDSGSNVPGAVVKLSTSSLVHFTTYSSADADGYYEFLGVPEGDFTLYTTEPEGRRRASAGGGISEEGERVTVDLYLEATGSVTGTVWNPPGASAGPFDGVNTVVREGTRVVGSSLDNPFTIGGLIVGRGLHLEAYEVAGDHRAVASAVVSEQGELVTVDLTMQPIGTVGVTVSDSFGSPVSGADLRLTSAGFYGRRQLNASSGADGRAVFADVGEGWLNAFVINPVNGLKGSATGQLTLDGEQVEIAVQLEDAASLRGRLLLADGVTPAQDALVTVNVSGRQYQLRADVNGDFELPSLPLGSFTLYGSEYFGDAAYIQRSGTLAVNGEIVDLGTLVLDDEDPEVVAHTPPSGASDLPLSTAVTLQFNEPLDRSRFSSSWFRFRKLSGAGVSYTATWSAGDAAVTLTPNGALANFTAYEVVVEAAYDLAGRGLKERIKTVFSTVDQQPPGVVDVLPRNGAVQVPVDTNLRVNFSEPVELASLSGTSLALVDTSNGQQVTTTWQLVADDRLVIVTPQTALLTDRTYQLTVQGVRDNSGNTMTVPVVTSFKTPDTIAPSIDAVTFPAGTSFTAGDDVPVSVSASDASGVAEVRVVAGDWTFSDTAAPFDLTALAPVVASAGDVTLTIEAIDVYGNAGAVPRTIEVTPYVNASAPTITATCGQVDHLVVPGVETELALSAVDDQRLERLRLLVDGVEQDRVDLVLSPEGEASFLWTPPAAAQPGDTFAVRLEARDFAGNLGVQDLTARVPTGTVLVGARSLFDDYAGQDLVLAEGTFLAREALNVASLTIVRGGGLTNGDGYDDLELTADGDLTLHCGAMLAPTARSTDGARLRLVVPGTFTVESAATVDLEEVGYSGGVGGHLNGYAPAGVEPASTGSAGGSHGGVGREEPGSSYGGTPGDVFDSVYMPSLPGGGGSGVDLQYSLPYPGNNGGGALDLDVGVLVLDGTISARGGSCSQGSGGGGSLLVRAGTIRGGGRLDASGGDRINSSLCNSSGPGGGGGGGRVAIHADVLDGFDPATQVGVVGGRSNWVTGWASPGTLYVRLPTDTYGRLSIDQGMSTADAFPATELPALGGGAVTGFEAAGLDAWVTGPGFRTRWLGAWMILLDGSGGELGAFEVLDLDAGGRALLAGAAGVAGASAYRGEYRFDSVEVKGGAGLLVSDPLVAPTIDLQDASGLSGPVETGTLVVNATQGATEIPPDVMVTDLVIRSGAKVTAPAGSGGALRLTLPGTLTVEAGAELDARGAGYNSTGGGLAPTWVTPATQGSGGGSHGGTGTGYPGYGGLPGDVFGSVYLPTLTGGSGAGWTYSPSTFYPGGAGGGLVEIDVGELVLDGTVSVQGGDSAHGGGAGGALIVRTGSLRGAGLLEASGGGRGSNSGGGSGGGGRVAIYGALAPGFDPATQVRAVGGEGHWSVGYAAAGTIYLKQPGDTYGVLRIDQRMTSAAGAPATELPALGGGSVVVFEPQGSDAWVTADEVLRPRWSGAWMTLLDEGGGELGTFEVSEVDAGGRVLLEGAAVVTGSASYRGEYRFDRVEVHGGAGLVVTDPLVSPDLDLEEVGTLGGPLRPDNLVVGPGAAPIVLDEDIELQDLTLLSGAVLTAGEGSGGVLHLDVAGTMTVEAGAVLDVTGAGYGATAGEMAPPLVTPATVGSGGGSHGGQGSDGGYRGGEAGEVFGSVFEPQLGGGAGAEQTTGSGERGGGVVDLTVGTLVLDGVIAARGDACHDGSGAGGSVRLHLGTLRGTGSIDASGGDRDPAPSPCGSSDEGAGGGGRVAIHADLLDGFDPAIQVFVAGGEARSTFAAAGTLYVRQTGDTYGSLRIDQEQGVSGTVLATELPSIGRGTVGVAEADGGEPADLWIEPEDPDVLFSLGVSGAYVRIGGVDYRVIGEENRRRLLLENASGAVSVGEVFVGVYKFDDVHVSGRASLLLDDGLVVGGQTVVDSGSTLTFRDLDDPVVTITAPASGTVVSSGDPVTVTADVADASAITQVVFSFGAQTVTDTAAPWQADLSAPVVTTAGDVEIRVEATDADDNVGVATRDVTVQPLAPSDPPEVAFGLPSQDALLAAGVGLDVTVTASHDDGIEKVEFLLGNDPTVLGTDTTAPYTFHYSAPAGAADGDVLTLRARAWSFSASSADAIRAVSVVVGNVLQGDTFLAAGDLSLEDTSVVVAVGTLTVEGSHSFRDLVVLDGAAVTHPAITSSGEAGLDLTVTRDVYVAAGGAVDASGRGWPAAVGRSPVGGEGVLSSEDFSGDLSAWQVVDDATYQGPSNWHIYAGYLKMTSNVHEQGGVVGTHIYRTDAFGLDDYRLAFRLDSGDDDGIGVVFRYQDPDNYYRLLLHRAAAYRRLEKRVDGVFTTLAEDNVVGYAMNRWYEMEVVADGPHLEIWMDGERILDAEDATFSSGSYGFLAVGNAGSYFDDVRVVSLGGAAPVAGGSHAGRGAGFTGTGRIVGSPYDPTDPGAGGGSRLGTAGGGVVRLAAGGDVVIDGALRAAGATSGGSGPFGAGGAVRLDAEAIRGAGLIDASGGGDGTARAGGGGGRAALYAATVEPGIMSRTTAAGGAASTAALSGGAGTVFVQRDAQPLGDLILDNGGNATDAWTELLSAPAGDVDVVGVDTLNDAVASFPHSLYGTEVALNGDTSNLWTVLGHADGGDTLTLDVSATPWSAVPGDGYELLYRFDSVTVRGGARGVSLATVQSTAAPSVETGSEWYPGYLPGVTFSAPADGATATSGSPITVTAQVDDVLGVETVTLLFDGSAYVDSAPPFSWTVTAPIVASSSVYPLSLTASDLAGHQLVDEIDVTVAPSSDPTPPQVTLGASPADGDVVLVGSALGLPFTVTDAEQLYAWRVKVDGIVVEEALGLDVTQADATVTWAPPAGAAAGTVYSVVVEAQDYGGNLASAQRTVQLPLGPALSGDQTVDGSYDGEHLTLGAGTFTVTAPLNLASLTILDGAVVTTPAGGVLRVDTPGEVRVQIGGAIDVTGRGYTGGSGASAPGAAPAGVLPSYLDSGGSHGGSGYWWDDPDSSGEVYDSVYLPQLSGGGGSNRKSGKTGGAGGGIIELTASELTLEGTVVAAGQQVASLGNGESSGAGGTVLIQAGVLRGGGTIRADGGEYRYRYSGAGPGGGGRVALHVTTLDGFAPSLQAQALPGLWRDYYGNARHHAAAGTVYVRTGTSTYGDLRVDSGTFSTTVPLAPQTTTLPVLGAGAVSAVEIEASDLWVSGPAAYQTRWLGAWMALLDATGGELGTFEVVDLDGAGRALLAGAGTVSGAMSYRGEYRFDSVVVDHGAGLEVSDPLLTDVFHAADAAVVEGPIEASTLDIDAGIWDTLWGPELRATDLTLRSGALVQPSSGGLLRLEVPGTLTIESGATLDVTGTGYAGGSGATAPGAAPAGVSPSYLDSGGSHGGSGYWWDDPDSSGEVYDSVYLPQLSGGGGSNRKSGKTGGAGGGLIELTVGELVLDGTISADGEQVASLGNGEAGGAGGTVFLKADVLRGSGTIRADGGEYRYRYSGAGPGGGGRVALHVTTLDGFDPSLQVQALPGLWRDYYGNARHHAAAGTVYVRTGTSTYGDLRVDSGSFSTTVPLAPQTTTLPVLGAGAVSAVEIEASDLWVSGPAAFQTRWLGAWMALLDATGGELGTFEVVDLDGAGRALLAGAGAVSGAVSYRGEYRFDSVVVDHGAGLEVSDPLITPDLQAADASSLSGPLDATVLDLAAGSRDTLWGTGLTVTDLVVRTGALVRPASGGVIRMQAAGTLTIETGATVDATGGGYLGGVGASAPGNAPPGVTASVLDGGGSHGGAGRWWDYADTSGEVYDSIYLPELAGGGGSNRDAGKTAGAGGGIVELTAGTLILDGEVLANGVQVASLGDGESSGAGGTVFVQAGVLGGSGSIEAEGADYRYRYSGGGPGGGGRVALHVSSLSGFDPATQALVRGGLWRNYHGNPYHYAAPGTLFVQESTSTFGDLYVVQDKGTQTILNTTAPAIGAGTVGTTEIDADETADLWIEPQDAGQTFALGVTGAWVRVDGVDYRILDQTADRRRVLLEDAAGIVSSGDLFAGVYKFDSVTVHNGAVLEFLDIAEPGTTDVDADSQLITP